MSFEKLVWYVFIISASFLHVILSSTLMYPFGVVVHANSILGLTMIML